MKMYVWNDKKFATATDAVAAILDNYPKDDPVASLEHRWEFAATLATKLQAGAVAQCGLDGLTPEQVTLVTTSRLEPGKLDWPATWDERLPLWLVATDFVPYTSANIPVGDYVGILDPSDEVSLLVSMKDVGFTPPVLVDED